MLVTTTPTRQRLGQLEPLPERLPPALDSERGLQLFLGAVAAVGLAVLLADELRHRWRKR